MLLELLGNIKQDKTLVELLFSKICTFPLLLVVLSKLITNDPKAIVADEEQSTDDKTKDNSPGSETKQYGSLGVPITSVSSDFDWSKQEPVKYRPFKKGEYKLTMGIHNISPNDWFFVEDTYKEYTDLKDSYVQNPDLFDHNTFMTPDCADATEEFYNMTVEFMVQRYPMCFEIQGDLIHNKIRNDYIPLSSEKVTDKKQLIVYLSRFIEEDFIILFPDPENFNTDEYIFKGGCFAFAAGFDPAVRFLKPLTDIHGPVPEYKTKLKPQMNKFFDKLKPYTYVQRNNWSIQTHNRVFVMDDNKGVEGEELKALDPDTLDFHREVFFRSERQILTKLPKTGAIVFSIRTYLTPMAQIRDEGLQDELIGGIEGMQETIGQYKRRPEWGEPVIKFLKGESNGVEKPWIKGLE